MATGRFSLVANWETAVSVAGWLVNRGAGAMPMVTRSESTSSRQCRISFWASCMAALMRSRSMAATER